MLSAVVEFLTIFTVFIPTTGLGGGEKLSAPLYGWGTGAQTK